MGEMILACLLTASIASLAFSHKRERVPLPPPRGKGPVSVEEAIAKRRSTREYSREPLSLGELSQLLWSVQGVTDPARRLRAAPSAGATFPLEVYAVVGERGVEGLRAGVYRYDPGTHSLELVVEGDLRRGLASAALGQEWVEEAPVNIVITAIYERTTWRYGERGIRYVHMEVGHAGQNLYLQATALGLGTVAVGAFYDEEVRGVLKLPGDRRPLYIMPVGRPR